MTAIAEPVPQKPEQVFRLRAYEMLETLADSNTDLPDIISQVHSTKKFRDGVTNYLVRVLVNLQLESGKLVRLTAFDGQASLLEKLIRSKNFDVCVLLATNINPRRLAGNIHVNATAGTRFFTNYEVGATRDFMEGIKTNIALAKFKSVQKIENASLAEIHDFICTANPQMAFKSGLNPDQINMKLLSSLVCDLGAHSESSLLRVS